jgi:H/ACA ribonucleoprotein complex subunit 2
LRSASQGKEKKEKKEKVEDEVAPAAAVAVCAIAKPLAGEKLVGKVLKVVKKAAKRKQMKRGVKEARAQPPDY